MRIGQLAASAGVTTSRIRFYEARGLLPPPPRQDNGYRRYDPRDLKILTFIERAARLGFSLREIRDFLNAPDDERSAAGFLPRLEAKLIELDRHIEDAQDRRNEIVRLIVELRTRF